jgi:inner membrane protein
MNKSISLKLFGIFVVFIAMSVVLQIIGGIVNERSQNRDEAIRSVMESSAGAQNLTGPVLQLMCSESWAEIDGKKTVQRTESSQRTFAPLKLNGKNTLKVEARKRGIFTAQVYTLKSSAQADWDESFSTAFTQPSRKDGKVECYSLTANVGISDARGIQSAHISINGVAATVKSSAALFKQGVHADLDVKQLGKPISITVDLVLNGAQNMEFVPSASETQIDLSSNWPHPSFIGRSLPTDRSTPNDQGFTATWKSTALSSTVLQELESAESNKVEKIRGFEVSFIDPVDHYALSYRATHYGFLFVLLTFMAVGIIEWQHRAQVHPIQYLLVGSAMVIFFLLLLSASEHIGFSKGYLIGASACILLLAYYAGSILRSKRVGMVFGACMAAMYGVLFILLSLEQTALLVGAFTLFLVLAGIMVYTRKVNWYTAAAAEAKAIDAPIELSNVGTVGG